MSERFEGSTFEDHEAEIVELKRLGFGVNPLNKTVSSVEEGYEYAEHIHRTKDTLPYEIDGVVLKLKNNTLSAILGVVGKTPRGWGAIKFAGDEVTTKILGVSWQVGRTGKVTPVADLKPTLLAGTTVKRATLHNAKEVIQKDLHIGDTVVIHKAGDIIPEVKQVLVNLRVSGATKPILPSTCPSCNEPLTYSSTQIDLLCTNYSCPDQVVARLSYYTQRSIANIAGLSNKNIAKFVELFEVSDVADLYNLPYDKILELEGFGQKSVDKLKQSLEESKQITAHKFFAGLGIDGVGPEVASVILQSLLRDTKTSLPQTGSQDLVL